MRKKHNTPVITIIQQVTHSMGVYALFFPFLCENYQLSLSLITSAVEEFLRELQTDIIMPYLSPKARSAAIPVGMFLYNRAIRDSYFIDFLHREC